jgi:hypothetical protein
MKKLLALLLSALILHSTSSYAQTLPALEFGKDFKGGAFYYAPAITYPLPLGSNTVAAAYSFRKLRSAYAGSAVQLTRLSDSTTQNIGFAPNNFDFDKATATAFCAATSCYVSTWYDQSGNGANLIPNNTNAVYTPSCQNGQPCITDNGTAYLTGTLASTVAADTFAIVANTSQMATSFWWGAIGVSTDYTGMLYSTGTSTAWSNRTVASTSHKGTEAISNSVTYRMIGTNNANLSSIYINGTKGTDDTSSVTLAPSNSLTIGASAGHSNMFSGILAEIIIFAPDLSITDSNTISLNQKTYWGTL